MCRLQNLAMGDYQESVTTDRQTDRQTDAGQSDPYVPLCFAGDTKMIRNFGLFCSFVIGRDMLFLSVPQSELTANAKMWSIQVAATSQKVNASILANTDEINADFNIAPVFSLQSRYCIIPFIR